MLFQHPRYQDTYLNSSSRKQVTGPGRVKNEKPEKSGKIPACTHRREHRIRPVEADPLLDIYAASLWFRVVHTLFDRLKRPAH